MDPSARCLDARSLQVLLSLHLRRSRPGPIRQTRACRRRALSSRLLCRALRWHGHLGLSNMLQTSSGVLRLDSPRAQPKRLNDSAVFSDNGVFHSAATRLSYSCYRLTTGDPPLFTPNEVNEPSLLAYMLQQIGVPLTSLIGSLILLNVIPGPPWSVVRSSTAGQIVEVLRDIGAAVIVGSLLAFVMWRIQSARSVGRWIWILPAAFVLVGFLSDMFEFSTLHALSAMFFPGPDGENWWAFKLLTCPTISAMCYSAVMIWRIRRPATPD